MKTTLALASLLILISPASAQRLPPIAAPESYRLTLSPDLDKASFEGDETIQIRLLKPTSEIVLNSAEIDIHSATVTRGRTALPATVSFDKSKETATLTLPKSLPAGPATLYITYTGILNDQLRGFYLGKDDQGRKYAATQLENTDARRAFPSFDEPIYKATFDVTVIAPKGLTVISNTRALSDTPGPGDKHTVHFATTPRMSSYLVAVIVGQFEYIEGSADGTPIRIFASPGKKNLSTFALHAAEYNLHFYNQYFGIKYPYGKLDLVGLSDFSAGAMENTGCITVRDAVLLVDEKNGALSTKKLVASDIAHEMAHQWFGDLVTMKWWDDKWLNEGFATWLESKPVAAWKPEWHVELDEVNSNIDSLNLDSLLHTHPIHVPVENAQQSVENDDAITYGKAAAVIRMLESYLGEQTFRAGTIAYLKKYAYQNANTGDFWNTQTEVSKRPVNKIMSTWVEQPGAPLLTVTSKCSGSSASLGFAQQRYFYDRTRMEQGSPELWQIPACLRDGSAPASSSARCELITSKQQTISFPSCAPWYVINANSKGFYRSGYDSPALHQIGRQVETALNPSERIMLLADVWASVRVNREPIGDYLGLAEDLKADRNDGVLSRLLEQLRYIGERLTDDSDQPTYSAWLRRVLAPVAHDVGWTPKPGESESMNSLRGNLLYTLATIGNDPEAQSIARNLAEKALADPDSVNHELGGHALQAAARNGDEALYNKILADMKNAKSPETLYRDAYALTGFGDAKLVARTLQLSLSPNVRSQDSPYLIFIEMQQPFSQRQSWSFVQAHWEEIQKLGGAFAAPVIVQGTGAFCDPALRDEVRDFFIARAGPAAQRSLKQSLERINYCIDLRQQQRQQLASWLQEHQPLQAITSQR